MADFILELFALRDQLPNKFCLNNYFSKICLGKSGNNILSKRALETSVQIFWLAIPKRLILLGIDFSTFFPDFLGYKQKILYFLDCLVNQ